MPDGDEGQAAGGTNTAPLTGEAAHIRAEALASAQRLVEAARRSAKELYEQAARQSEAMVRTAQAEVERLTEEANSRQEALNVQQVSWDAPGLVLEAAGVEADQVRTDADARAGALLTDAHKRAEGEASQALQAARTQAEQEKRQVAREVQAAWEELSQLHELSASLLTRLDLARDRLGRVMGIGEPAAAGANSLVAACGAESAPRTQPSGPIGEVDLVLPEHADRMTVEVMMAVLREQPGITVQAATRRSQALVIPLVIDRPVPLVPILQELPRVVATTLSTASNGVSTASGGHVIIELGDR
ncbi:MAG: hypothetical protein ACR2JY_17885 [Chloroflexota bacterium]